MGMTAVPKSNVAAASEEDASSVNADLQRVYDLKATFQQRQDVRVSTGAPFDLCFMLRPGQHNRLPKTRLTHL